MKSSIKYLPELDGLRSIAIIPVIFFHYTIPFFSGGFIGVDIFFVLSGFLISSIILNQIKDKNFSYLNFYFRRAKRLLPSLLFMLSIMSFAAWTIFLPDDLRDVFQQVISSSLFLSNIHFALTWDYFASWKSAPLFLNTWSLGVEEQFYLIYPLILTFLIAKNLNSKLWIFVLAIASFIYMSSQVAENPIVNYYMITSRFWELAAGGILAISMDTIRFKLIKVNKKFGNTITIFSFAILAISIVLLSKESTYPSVYTLFPVIATVILIAFINIGNKVTTVLANPILVYIGKISYPLYLFHFPIYIFLLYMHVDGTVHYSYLIIALLLTLILSMFSYHLIEGLVRNEWISEFRYMFIVFLITFLLLSMATFGHFKIIKGLQLKENPWLLHTTERHPAYNDYSKQDCGSRLAGVKCKLLIAEKKPKKKIILVGDSFAYNLTIPLAEKLRNNKNISLDASINFACSFMPSGASQWGGECERATEMLKNNLKNDYTDIIFHINFIGYLTSKNQAHNIDDLDKLKELLIGLQKNNVNIHVISHRPVFNFFPAKTKLFNQSILRKTDAPNSLNNFYTDLEKAGINLLNSSVELTKDNAHLFYNDRAHLSSQGSMYFISGLSLDDLFIIK